MANGGFLVKFDGKEIVRCYAIAFDYDKQEYVVNNREKHMLPTDVNSVSIEVERS